MGIFLLLSMRILWLLSFRMILRLSTLSTFRLFTLLTFWLFLLLRDFGILNCNDSGLMWRHNKHRLNLLPRSERMLRFDCWNLYQIFRILWIRSKHRVSNLHVNSADSFSVCCLDLDVSAVSPAGAPGVLENEVLNAILFPVTHDKHAVIKFGSAIGRIEDSSTVSLEHKTVCFNHHGDWSINECLLNC